MGRNMNRRVREWLKNGMIALLAVSAILLGRETGLFNDFISSIPLFDGVLGIFRSAAENEDGSNPASGVILREAARPSCIVITQDGGLHYGVRYDTDEKDRIYERTSSIFGETLGSALAPEEITTARWQEALGSPGVYFEYDMPVSLPVLAGWLGARSSADMPVGHLRRVCVTFGDEMNRIFFEDSETGLFYMADTASFGGRSQVFGMYTGNGAQFAFEAGLPAKECEPYMLLMPGSLHPILTAANPVTPQEELDGVLAVLGINSRLRPPYVDGDGTTVYIGAAFRVSVDARGRAVFSQPDGYEAGGLTAGEGELIERARNVVFETIGKSCGDATVNFEAITAQGDSIYSVTFGYYAAGGRIHLYEDGYAAKITFAGGKITEMRLNFRSYGNSGELYELLPERQALAASGTEFVLSYADSGGERLTPDWVKRK